MIAKALTMYVERDVARRHIGAWLHLVVAVVVFFAAMHPQTHAFGASAPTRMAADTRIEASFTPPADFTPDEAPTAPDSGSVCAGSCKVELAGPVHFLGPAYIPVVRAGWPVLDDQWAQVTRPSRLERPPRA
ncbi:hypothetical protein [Phenylobacterium conjunctum]|uniref:Uncharacterized protein n=1 Tax=Phenylobacterium conjunctum TaxID=1298959 RepID=A0ABW3T5X3_9CAUL